MRKRSGRSNASASAKTVARSENCRARAFRSLLLGMLFRRLRGHARTFCEWQSAGVLPPSACQRCDSFISADTFVHTASGRAQAFHPLLLEMLFRRLRGRDRSFCEWQSAGVLRLLYARGTIPLSAPARSYIRRRRSAPPVVGAAVPTLAPDASERCGSVGLCPCGGYGRIRSR